MITDEDGNVVKEKKYEAFGNIVWEEGVHEDNREFTGKEKDPTGFHYFGARYYYGNIGRFLSPDPHTVMPGNLIISDPQTLNPYTYCANDPLYFVDPNGLFSIHVEFQYNRVNKGILILYDKQGNLVNCWEAKGMGYASGHEDRLVKFGDTPTGTYRIKEIIRDLDPKVWSKHSYGPHGVIRMEPESGEALDAEEEGRTGLLIHGGELGNWKEEYGKPLRKTGGCIRLWNNDMRELLDEIDDLREEPEEIKIRNIEDDVPDIDPNRIADLWW